MKFRRTVTAVRGGMFLVALAVSWLILQAFLNEFNIWVSLFAAVSGISGLLMCICMDNEYINIDEEGIACIKKNTLLWSFTWDEIEALKFMRGRFPKVYIMLKNSDDGFVAIEEKGLWFEYRHIAKKALGKYCSKSEKSGWYVKEYIRKTDV